MTFGEKEGRHIESGEGRKEKFMDWMKEKEDWLKYSRLQTASIHIGNDYEFCFNQKVNLTI